jgi:hypothetical protein
VNKRDLRKLAKQHYIFDASLSKAEIIRAIQRSEGNFDCYGRADTGECDQLACGWRQDCLPESIQCGSAAAAAD